MKNMRVSKKLIISFIAVIIMAVIVGAVGIFGMNSINQASSRLYDEDLTSIRIIGEIRETIQRQRVSNRMLLLYSGETERFNATLNDYRALDSEVRALFNEYEAAIAAESEESAYYEAKRIYLGDYARVSQEIADAAAQSFEAGYAKLNEPFVSNTVNSMIDAFTQSSEYNDNRASEANLSNDRLFITMLIVAIAVLALAIVVALFFAFYISGLISKPLTVLTGFMNKASSTGDITLSPEETQSIRTYSLMKDEVGQTISATAAFVKHITEASEILGDVSKGDLTHDIEPLSNKDVIGNALHTTIVNLNNMFGEINNSTSQVSTGSKQIADGAQALAQGSTEQAAAVEQLSSSISEIAQKTKENADMAGKAANLAGTIKQSAEKGSSQMDQMMDAVKEINQASQNINKVISVIDNIAFQTNILALNAAVEAARAGQHGKGFAVVAEEVRSLASKSAEAAKETGALIANSMEKAELGARIADETAASLVEIVAGINESTQLVTEIAKSSEEQSMGISQVNKGIDQVAQVVQQNSATAEESAAASEEMSGQSSMLEELISQFKLRDDASFKRSSLPSSSAPKTKKQLVMPEKTDYMPPVTDGDFGKY